MPFVGSLERRPRARDMAEHEIERLPGHQLEALDGIAHRVVEQAEERQRLFRRGKADPRYRSRYTRRYQPEGRRGDPAERAFGAAQHRTKVVAAIGLLDPSTAVDD